MNSALIRFCDRIIRAGFFLLVSLVPLLLTPWNYELFEYNKMVAVYGLTVIIVGSWITKMVAQKELRVAKTPFDIPILLFLLSQLVSSLFSMDRHVSWFGYYSRFNGGLLSVISYVLLYYAFVTNAASELFKLLKGALGAATIIALYAVLERLGIDKHLWVQDVQNRVFSTLGQPNWLAAYLTALVPLTWHFALKTQMSKPKIQNNLSLGFWIWSFITALFFLVVLFTRSRSGLLGFVVADAFFWGILWFYKIGKKVLKSLFLAYHIGLVVIVFFNGSNMRQLDYFSLPGLRSRFQSTRVVTGSATPTYVAPALESGGTDSGIIRKYVWEGAINAWYSSSKTILIGTGTETFAFAFYQFRPAGHNQTSEWDFLYNKAHNEYLNYLATTGIFGLGSYLLFIGSVIWWFVRLLQAESTAQDKNSELLIVNSALFAGWISILVTNFFGFSIVVIELFLFLLPAFMFIYSQQFLDGKMKQLHVSLTVPQWVLWLPTLTAIYLLWLIGAYWYADTRFVAGYRMNRAGNYASARKLLSQATSLNPREPFYHDELGSALAGLAVEVADKKDATTAATLAQESLRQSDIALMISPRNVNFWKTRTKTYYAFSSFDPQFNQAAIKTLEHALELSPRDPKILYNIAILYGRQGQNSQAIEELKKTIELKPDYRDAYFALSIFYNEIRDPQQAKAILQEYLDKIDPNDKDFRERVK